ncbi:NB-ARC domain-containing protein [Amycolatopsis pigmentata]|uniref:NB-ARC domain-containing protein n=1 Tax=Amycolatopsis pigmentata TaxID=450801 RepID=A0ABW5FZ61_9PSEU
MQTLIPGGDLAGREPLRRFGSELRSRREEQGMSLRKLARLVAYSPGWLSRIENAAAAPTIKLAELCDRALLAGGELIALARDAEPAPVTHSVLPAQLPRPVSPFVGRTAEFRTLDRIHSRASLDGRGLTVAIDGPPGVGKTALVTGWAGAASHAFGDGVLYEDLQGYSSRGAPLDPAAVLKAFLFALGVSERVIPEGIQQRSAMFRTLVSDRRMLVVLDNAADSHQVAPLLPGAGTCSVVVTSRRRMSGIAARSGAFRIALEPMSPGESLELLALVVGRERVRAEIEGARALVLRCAGLPLALRAAAERLTASRHRSLGGLAQELAGPGDADARLDLLTGGDGLTVRESFEASYHQLDAESSRAFRLLGQMPGEVVGTADAAALLRRPKAQTRRLLEVLIGVNLLAEVGPDQYLMDGPLALFAEGRAVAEGPFSVRLAQEASG